MDKERVALADVPETMLWTLYNRASEAERPDGVLRDDAAISIYRRIAYDFQRSFGRAEPSHAVRSALFDAELRAFLADHPDGVIVNLGEGLETQRFRVEGASALWIAVDVPTAMAVRERFIAPDEWHLHVPVSVMDRHWFDAVPRGRPVYLTAQGLLMYFEPDEVAGLFRDLAKRFPGAWLAFDHIPRWFARKTLRGFQKTRAYRAPPMPWGINLDEVAPTVRAWVPDVAEVRRLPFRFPRGLNRAVFGIWTRLPGVRHKVPGCTRVRFGLKREAS